MNAVFSMHQVNLSSAFESSNIIFFFFNTFMSDDVDPDDDDDRAWIEVEMMKFRAPRIRVL